MQQVEERKAERMWEINLEAMAGFEYRLPLSLGLASIMAIVSGLQLALRHPGFVGPTADLVREIIDSVIERVEEDGLANIAVALRMGDNPEYDDVTSSPPESEQTGNT